MLMAEMLSAIGVVPQNIHKSLKPIYQQHPKGKNARKSCESVEFAIFRFSRITFGNIVTCEGLA
jgi:hypothetical protein